MKLTKKRKKQIRRAIRAMIFLACLYSGSKIIWGDVDILSRIIAFFCIIYVAVRSHETL
jgi:hypothetical protein